jgi:tetratricopeptide (TPR) repeat protein
VDAYINLGVLWKMADDFEGAILAWEYAKEMSPTYYSPYHNLGNLYLYELKDNALSETNLQEAIRLNPQLIDAWKSLHDLYRYEMAQTPEAEAALTEALRVNPNHLDLMLSLARYYKETGEIAKARSMYTDALAIAEREAAQDEVPDLIREEIQDLE